MEHAAVFIHVEVEVDFHAALVGMARHGVPQVARCQLGQSHAELAGLQHVRHEVFIDGAAVAGEVADNVKFAFYAGAAILLASVLWTIFKTKEYSPEEMAEFRLSGGEVIEKRRDSNGFMEIMHDIFHMPKIMLQLGLCQFFAWFALYSMWVYSTPAIAEHVYGATDPASAEYAMAGDKVGELFSIYNFVAMLFALLLIPIARHLGRKMTHALCLCLGGDRKSTRLNSSHT